MKKFEFPLTHVLDFKNQVLDREKNELARRRQKKTSMKTERTQLQYSFYIVKEEMNEKTKQGTTAFVLQSYQFRLNTMREDMSRLQNDISLQEELVEEQLAVVVGASQDVSGLDKLKTQQVWQI